jgi:hypothetical protein
MNDYLKDLLLLENKMKIGWLLYCNYYEHLGEPDFEFSVEFYKEKPEYYSGRLVQIVYAEVIE